MAPQANGNGARVDRLAQEFVARLRRGERPSVQEYVDRYPDLADEIRGQFPTLVDREPSGGENSSPATQPEQPPAECERRVGGYRIIRQLGRGGMGIVYEAEQLSLGRRVALKLLPVGPSRDARALERFRREAKAAAKLHHTNIVPVFEVGEDGDDAFYAMQLIDGQPLDRVINELQRLRGDSPPDPRRASTVPDEPDGTGGEIRNPKENPKSGHPRERVIRNPKKEDPGPEETARRFPSSFGFRISDFGFPPKGAGHFFHSAARLGHQAATALAHAHARGIVHRDVKPSNLLLDAAGVVWVTDFGLAYQPQEQARGEPPLTHAGDILGTLRYMAPERFQGECDARADLYALGLTLYELLTLRPAFDETDRLRLVEQIKDQEPPRPRSLDPRIPRDLETIVLKASDKLPGRRYQSADDLAEDLRRFLADEPIRARRASLRERVWRWCRRNPVVAGLSALLLTLLCAATAGSVMAALRLDRLARDNARVAEEAVEAQQKETQERERAEEAERKALGSLREARAQRQRAEVNFGHARTALDEYLVRVSESELLKAPGMQPLRRELLESALKFYQKFLREQGDVPELRVALVIAHVRAARIYRDLGLHAESRESADEALALARALEQERPDDAEARNALAEASRAAGDFQRAIDIWKRLLDPAKPRFQRDLADCYNVLAVRAGNDNRLAESLAFHQEALTLRRRLVELVDSSASYRDLGSTLNNLGVLLHRQKRLDEALSMYRESVKYARIAHERAPQDIVAGQFLVIVLRNLGARDRADGDLRGAVGWYEQAADVARRMLADNPAVPRLYEVLFDAHTTLADLHGERKEDAGVDRHVREAMAVADRHPRQGGDNLYLLATMRAWCGEALGRGARRSAEQEAERKRQAELAVAALREAVAAGYRNHRRAEGQAEFRALAGRQDFRDVLTRLRDAGRAAELVASHSGAVPDRLKQNEQALALRDRLARQEPKNLHHRADLAASHHSIGLLQLQIGQFDEAGRAVDEAVRLWKALVKDEPGDIRHRADLSAALISRGSVEWKAGRLVKALPPWQEAVASLEELVKARPDDTWLSNRLAAAERTIGRAYASVGLWEEALPWTARATDRQPLTSQSDGCAHAALLWVTGDTEGYRRFCERMRGRFGTTAQPQDLARALALATRTPVEPARAVELAQRALRARPADPTLPAVLALAHYRAGEHAKALARLREADLTRAVAWPLLAMVHNRLGNAEEARSWLRLAEQRHEQMCRAHLHGESLTLLGFTWPPTAGWEDWPHFQALLREARELIRGTGGEDDPWFRLVRGRAYALLGKTKEADEEFRRAAAARPEDAEVWLVRGLVDARLGRHGQALAHFDRAVEAGKDGPRAWIARGRYYLERGQDAKADADFAQAAGVPARAGRAKGDLTPFLQAGWWVAGPYAEELQRACPPEKDPHPSRPIDAEVRGPKSEVKRDGSRRWRLAPAETDGRVELGLLFGGAEYISAYALNYVYSPEARDATLYVGSDDTVRVWLNGRLVHEYPAGREAVPRQDTVRVTLKAGRNVLLVKVGNGIVEHRFYLSAGGPFDRGLARAERGLWREAAALTAEGLAAEPSEHPVAWVQDAILKRAAGDDAGYRRAAARLMERYGRSSAAGVLTAVARACSLGPDVVPDAARLVEMAQREEAKESWRVVHVALARHRAGQPEQAVQAIKQRGAEDWPVSWPVLALAHHRLGKKDEARRWLERAEAWLEETLDEALVRPGVKLPLPWMDWAEFLIVRHEARQALGAGKSRADEKLEQLDTRARAALK